MGTNRYEKPQLVLFHGSAMDAVYFEDGHMLAAGRPDLIQNMALSTTDRVRHTFHSDAFLLGGEGMNAVATNLTDIAHHLASIPSHGLPLDLVTSWAELETSHG